MMNAALHFPGHRRNSNAPRVYATEEDFQQLFFAEITDLFRLSLQLTANAEKAERCLVDAMRDCFGNSAISRKFARVWAHRMIIRNAIRLVLGVDDDGICESECDFHLQPSDYPVEELRESLAILELPDFDRLVFVICVLERLSILDCALLLRRSPKDVNEAIVVATNRVAPVEHLTHTQLFTSFRTIAYEQDLVQ